MSKRFRAIKKDFKKYGVNLNNRKIRFCLHARERMEKIAQRLLNHMSKNISIKVTERDK